MDGEKNIALVVLDTLRADSFFEHFDWLTSRATPYDNAWSVSNWTIPAHASLFTGRHAREVGTHAKNRTLTETFPTIAEHLSESGYRTRGIVSNDTIGPTFDFDRGFDAYEVIETDSGGLSRHMDGDGPLRYVRFASSVLRSDDPTIETVKAGLRSKRAGEGVPIPNDSDSGASETLDRITSMGFDESEFLFLNLMETHSPYNPPRKYLSGPPAKLRSSFGLTALDGPDNPEQMRRAYQDSVRYLSSIYQEIHEELESEFDAIITVADHGEALGENGVWGHTSILNPEILKIPIVVWERTPSVVATEQPVNLLDVYQTVCDLADVDPGDGSRGRTLAEGQDRVRFTETHGLPDLTMERVESGVYPADVAEQYDQPLAGVATEAGYVFESPEGELEVEGDVVEPEKQISEFDDSVPVVEVDSESEVEGEMKAKLEALGYR